jgi:hypothetical protein
MSRRLLSVLSICLTVTACGGTTSPSAAGIGAASTTGAASVSPSPVVAARCDRRDLKFEPGKMDLTGSWSGDDDGIYYLRQVGKTLWWSGMSNRNGSPSSLGRDWNNVATGEIKDDLTIDLDWADVPRGEILGHGTLVWKVVDDGTGNARLVKLSETGSGFGGSRFTPCRPG